MPVLMTHAIRGVGDGVIIVGVVDGVTVAVTVGVVVEVCDGVTVHVGLGLSVGDGV